MVIETIDWKESSNMLKWRSKELVNGRATTQIKIRSLLSHSDNCHLIDVYCHPIQMGYFW